MKLYHRCPSVHIHVASVVEWMCVCFLVQFSPFINFLKLISSWLHVSYSSFLSTSLFCMFLCVHFVSCVYDDVADLWHLIGVIYHFSSVYFTGGWWCVRAIGTLLHFLQLWPAWQGFLWGKGLLRLLHLLCGFGPVFHVLLRGGGGGTLICLLLHGWLEGFSQKFRSAGALGWITLSSCRLFGCTAPSLSFSPLSTVDVQWGKWHSSSHCCYGVCEKTPLSAHS